MAAEPQQYTQRLVVLGAAGVGKSAIVAQFLFETFTEKYKKTVEELYCTEYDVYETKTVLRILMTSDTVSCFTNDVIKVRLDILDTSGSFEFPAMRKLSITNANAYLLVYAIDNPQSFEEIKSIRQEIIDIRGEVGIAKLPVVVVGNNDSSLCGSTLILCPLPIPQEIIDIRGEAGIAKLPVVVVGNNDSSLCGSTLILCPLPIPQEIIDIRGEAGIAKLPVVVVGNNDSSLCGSTLILCPLPIPQEIIDIRGEAGIAKLLVVVEIIDIRGEAGIAKLPVVVVGNKCDLEEKRQVPKEDAELVVELAWQHVFLESSAKERTNVVNIFKQLLHQAHIPCHLSPALRRRRASLPVTPSANGHLPPGGKDEVKPSMRRHNTRRRSSCKVQ
uniref:Small monomeric GTPase n=1 Tax=Branchiostoma floridae TaxID=7739 RepID=C3YF58_BRAFL|eukprot:XP_002605050.1 hypothetical protein BRAFLDRAFT_85196 [Branchiostoma floridae]